MTDELVEKVARAIYDTDQSIWLATIDASHSFSWDELLNPSDLRSDLIAASRAALAAIEQSGTHVVVPVEPTKEMLKAMDSMVSSNGCYSEMLAARPKQEDAL